MSDFFELPPPVPESVEDDEADFDLPPWLGPPLGALPGVVALELVLARSERAAVCITRLEAYSTGFGFEILAFVAPGQKLDLDPMLVGARRHAALRFREGELPPEVMRIGVQFADGSKATNLDGLAGVDERPAAPVMTEGGGGGGSGSWRQSEWVWPLPPPGPVSFVCEWPAAQIPLTRSEVDAQIVIDAAARLQVVFTASGRATGAWGSSRHRVVARKPGPNWSG
jgi:hypothetical protein